jgi:hypothetical protein
MEIDDAMDSGEPQTRAFFLCREKREKNLVQISWRNAFSCVLKGNFNDIAFAPPSINVTRPSRDGQLSAIRHSIKRIRGEVPKHLPHLVLVHLGREGPPGQ